MDIQEVIVTIIGIVVLIIIARKVFRIAKGKENACSCCEKTGCSQCPYQQLSNKHTNQSK